MVASLLEETENKTNNNLANKYSRKKKKYTYKEPENKKEDNSLSFSGIRSRLV